ncbi:MAG: hypothetical protein AAF547_06645 [Actinomycetota bacterium]
MTLHGDDMSKTYADVVMGRASTRRAEDGVPGALSEGAPPAGAAGGGGEDRPLVITALKSSKPVPEPKAGALRVAADRCQALTRDVCGELSEAQRIIKCGRCPIGQTNPRVKKTGGRAYASGVQTCGSVWACSWCSYKIRVKRAADIAFGVTTHLDTGGGVLHAVFTAPHRDGEDLDEFWRILSDVWQHVTSGRAWQQFKERFGLVGFIRSAEATHGHNGWHPHLHVLLFVDRPMSPVENEHAFYQLRRTLRDRWCRRMADKHGRTVSTEHGITVDPVKPDDANGSGSYVTKVGYELAMTNTKIGRDEGQRTPFAIAHDAATTGDMRDIRLWREWVQASHRKNSISWSNGLREHFGLADERSDEELASEDAGGETVVEVDRDLWRKITARRDGTRARFLAAFESYDHPALAVAAAVRLLDRLGLQVELDEQARSSPLLALAPSSNPSNKEIPAHAEHQAN